MNVGFVGLGKLGLPTALAIEAKGHRVIVSDPSPEVGDVLRSRRLMYPEDGAGPLLASTRIALAPLPEVVRSSDLIFVTIQTPHASRFEGVTRLPAERVDFDYSFLRAGVRELVAEVERVGEDRVVLIVSTVLPGTIRREIVPLLGPHTRLGYNPAFIAMGTTIADFLSPEMVLLGADDPVAVDVARRFYSTIHTTPVFPTTIENAELIKVLYNTFISTKIAFANVAMELCHRMPGTNVDVVLDALKLCRDRIISPKYLGGGMGDGGPCHPRDNIALSHLSKRLGLSFDWFEAIMMQRERGTEWLADLVVDHAAGREIVLLGKGFKPESSIQTGSLSLLLKAILEERGHHVRAWDPYIDEASAPPSGGPFCYFIATRHACFRDFPFERGSIVLDPWRYVPGADDVEIVRIGG